MNSQEEQNKDVIEYLESVINELKQCNIYGCNIDCEQCYNSQSMNIHINYNKKLTYEKLCENLKDGDKCLIRLNDIDIWHLRVFHEYKYNNFFTYNGNFDNKWKQCIPYEGNEEYLGKNKTPIG